MAAPPPSTRGVESSPPAMPSDATQPDSDSRELLARAVSGDQGAVHVLLERHIPGLQRFLARRAGPLLSAKESSSDLVQSVCREVLEHMQDARLAYRGEAEFKQWLYNAALFKIENRVRYWRAQRRDAGRETPADARADSSGAEALFATFATPSNHAMVKEELQRFETAFARLSAEHQQVILLARIEQLSHREIGEQLGISEANSRVLLSRALARLAKFMT